MYSRYNSLNTPLIVEQVKNIDDHVFYLISSYNKIEKQAYQLAAKG
jgi:hypothetical protein